MNKPKRTCLECNDKYIDCRNLMFCELKNLKCIGRRKEHKITPDWCPKWIAFKEIQQKLKGVSYGLPNMEKEVSKI